MSQSETNWWDKIVGDVADRSGREGPSKLQDMKGIFTDDNFFLAFPESNSHYVDIDINGQDLQYPSFKSEDWEGLVKEEFSYDRVHVMWETLSARGVRWVGSEANRMEICYVETGDWYFICKQGEQFFSVAIISSHPEVHCNDFAFTNSDGSTDYELDLATFQDPLLTLQAMRGIANEFIEDQTH